MGNSHGVTPARDVRQSPTGEGTTARERPPAAPGSVVLQLDSVWAGYGGPPAIRDIGLSVRQGEIVALFGANGAGKSTTLLTAMGRLPVTGGRVQWWDQPKALPLHRLAREGVAYVPEGRSVISSMSVLDNLRLGRGGVDRAVAYFPELAGLFSRPAGLLSGGEQQILVLARALASAPRVLLLDELSLGLAPIIVDRLLRVLREVVTSERLTVLMVEQQARRAIGLADRWYMLRNGRIVDEGEAKEGLDRLEQAYLVTSAPAGEATPPALTIDVWFYPN